MNTLRAVKLSGTDREASVIGFGTYHLLDKDDPYTAIESLGAAYEAGINFFDSSDNYGTELAIGRAVSEGMIKRDEVVIATKTGLATSATEAMAWGQEDRSQDTSPERIQRQVEKSLWLLGDDVGRIDLYQLHVYDPDVPAMDIARTMERLIDEEKIASYGVSNYPLAALAELRQVAAGNGLPQPVSVQLFHNALTSFASQDVIDYAKSEGMTVLAHSPLHKGALTDDGVSSLEELIDQVLKENKIVSNRSMLVLLQDGIHDLGELKEYANTCGIDLATLCIGWVAAQEETIVLTSCTNQEYISSAVMASSLEIDDEGLELIEYIRRSSSTPTFASQLLRIMKETKLYYR